MKMEKIINLPIYKKLKFKLVHLNIELTNKCQLDCKWCGDRKVRPTGEMPLSGVRFILNQVSGVEIRFFCSGEPTLYRRLPEAILLALMKNNVVLVHTNGVSLDEDMTKKILDVSLGYPKRITISFSIDGRDVEEYEKIRGPHLKNVLKNFNHFIRENEKFGSPVNVQVQSIFPYLADLDIHPKHLPLHSSVKYLTRWAHDWDREGSIPLANPTEHYEPPCGFLTDSLVIYWNGDVPICCADLNGDRIIGNIFKNPMDNLIRKIDVARRLQEAGKHCAICEGCGRYKLDN